jgi:hypothetical protein
MTGQCRKHAVHLHFAHDVTWPDFPVRANPGIGALPAFESAAQSQTSQADSIQASADKRQSAQGRHGIPESRLTMNDCQGDDKVNNRQILTNLQVYTTVLVNIIRYSGGNNDH